MGLDGEYVFLWEGGREGGREEELGSREEGTRSKILSPPRLAAPDPRKTRPVGPPFRKTSHLPPQNPTLLLSLGVLNKAHF